MARVAAYRQYLAILDDWEPFLLQESGLPGPRGNLELAQAVADEGNEALFQQLLAYDAALAPVNSPQEFLAFCGVLGLGRLLAEGRLDLLATLRCYANDSRWRVREGVAMALQRWGSADMDSLLEAMTAWSQGTLLERRAAAAALCEPHLLSDASHVLQVLHLLDAITASLLAEPDRKSEDFRVLRKGLGYCWSVAVVALPDPGQTMMTRWLTVEDQDIRWVMRENLRKNRLKRLDPDWVAQWTSTA